MKGPALSGGPTPEKEDSKQETGRGVTCEKKNTEVRGPSDPLLDVFDCVFELQSKGFLLRQVGPAHQWSIVL
jgi:hypothetical protein